MKKKITDLEKLKKEYESGLSTVKLAKKYGCSAICINGWLKKVGARMRSLKEAHADFRGKNHPGYKGRGIYAEDGAYLTRDARGYLRRILNTHPLGYANKRDGKVMIGEHVYQACLKYGVDEVRGKDVHHLNGIKDDNSWENIIAISRGEHRKMENNLN
jgi:hypothetical protein